MQPPAIRSAAPRSACDVRVPVENRLGVEGQGWQVTISALASERSSISEVHGLIRKIDEAITSLDGGEYGFCEACGIEIGIRRLEARPTATLCYDCKVLDEIREKQVG